MKKTIFTFLLISSLIACNDKTDAQLNQQLQAKEQTIKKLTDELKQMKTNALLNEDVFPALNVQIIPLFKRTDTIIVKEPTLESENPDKDKEISVDMFVSIATTEINWLNHLLNKATVENYKAYKKEAQTQAPEGKEREYLLEYLNKDYEAQLASYQKGNHHPYSFVIETEYIGQRNNLIAFKQAIMEYSDISSTYNKIQYINIDTNKKSIIQLNDLFTLSNQEKLKALLWNTYVNQIRTQPLPISENKFTLSDNFLITHQGIIFIYKADKLASLAEKTISLTLSWHIINDLITPDYQQSQNDGFKLNYNHN